MCGIVGYFTHKEHSEALIRSMAEQLRHRGPDDEGVVRFDDRFSLAHRRLAILDLSSAGHQPMATSDNRFHIVFNGEVYNYLELKAELEALGHQFQTQTDTDVILQAYVEWGQQCLQRFRGMFAFLIFDSKTQRLFAARDHFGIKPLYYWVSEYGIAMASEIKAFTVLPGWYPKINGQRVYDFLTWGLQDHTDETMFHGVYQLRGGESVTLDLHKPLAADADQPSPNSRLPVRRWYDMGPSATGDPAEFKPRFMESIALHLRSDVPVGSCLSGGLDSSAVVCGVNALFSEQADAPLQKTFSACSTESIFDERPWVDQVAAQTAVEPHYVYPDEQGLFDELNDIIWHQDEPFGSASIFYQWSVFKLAHANQIKVMLDGQGADEILAGYHPFFAPFLLGLFKSGKWGKLWQEMRAIRRFHGYSYFNQIQRIANISLPEPLRQLMRRLVGKSVSQNPHLDLERLAIHPADPAVGLGANASCVLDYSLAQLNVLNLPMLLHHEDRNSMAHSLEARVPFLDPLFVEWVLGLPDSEKIQNGTTKHVMRQELAGLVPANILNRMDKMGFVAPEEIWLREKTPNQFRAALDEAITHSGGIIKPSAKQALEEMIDGTRPFDHSIWRFISFGAWLRVFNVRL
jgi:asparagine synthase (glutamine-hydrolysing)